MSLKHKNIYITIFVIILIILFVSIMIILNKKEEIFENDISSFDNQLKNIEINEILSNDKEISIEEQKRLDEVKENFGFTGNSELYELQTDFDNIEMAVIKPNIKYKVAFAGMIKNEKPELGELDNIIEKNHPKYAGIFIEVNSRKKFMDLLSNQTKSTYKIDENGYLKVEDNKKRNDNDKIIQKVIRGDKLYIIDISSVCYIVDDITGEILDYNFEKLDQYQTYEYFKDNNRCIIFVTENTNNLMTKKEIITSLIRFIS